MNWKIIVGILLIFGALQEMASVIKLNTMQSAMGNYRTKITNIILSS